MIDRVCGHSFKKNHRHGFCRAVVGILILINTVPALSAQSELEPVTIQLRWFHQFQFAGYYAAVEKGFYADEGLQVYLREFEPGKDRMAPVIEGQAQYGVGGPSLLKLRMQGKPVVVLAQIFQHSPEVLIARRESGIFSADELVGKIVMLPLDDIGSASIQAMILEEVGDLNRITVVPHTFNDKKFINGDVDAMSVYLSNEPFKLKTKGVGVNFISPRSSGIDFYGDNLFTTGKEVVEHPERVNKMIRATIKGWAYALEQKDEIIDLILTKYNQDLNREHLRYEAKVIDQMIAPDLVPIGEINLKRYDRIAETYHRLGMSTASTVPDGFIYKAEPESIVALTAEERVWLKSHPIIRFSGDPAYLPLEAFSADGKHIGIFADILDLLESRLDVRFERVPVSTWSEAVRKAEAGEVDFLSESTQSGRDKLLTNPHTQIPVVIIGRKGTPAISSPAELKGRKVAFVKGYTVHNPFREANPEINFVEVESTRDGLLMVTTGGVDAFISTPLTASYLMSELGLENLSVIGYTGAIIKLGFGVRRDAPQLVSILNKALSTITQPEKLAFRVKWSANKFERSPVQLTPEERAWLKAHPDIELGYTDAFEPEVIINPDGSYRGILVDILAQLNSRLGTRIRLRIDPIPEVIEKMQEKEIDGIMSLHPGFAEKLGVLKTRSYISSYPAVFARKDVSFNRPSDLAGKKVAIIDKLYFSEQIVKQHGKGATILKVKDAKEGLQSIDNRQADLFIGSSLHAYLITKYQLIGLTNRYIFYDSPVNGVIGTRSDWPELVSILNKGLSSFSTEEIEMIVAKWVQRPVEKQVVTLTPEERAWLEAHPEIRIGLPEGLEPYVMSDQQGNQSGILVDFKDVLNQNLGTNLVLETMPSSRILEMSRNREIDVIYAVEPYIAEQENLLQTKVWAIGYPAIYARQGISFKKPEDMAGKKIVIRPNTAWDDRLIQTYAQNATLVYAETPLAAMKMVLNEKADMYLGLTSHNYVINKYRLFGITQAHMFADTKLPFVMGIRSDWPLLPPILNKGLTHIGKEGLRNIVSKWIQPPKQEKVLVLDTQEQAWLSQKHIVQVRVINIPPYIILKKGHDPEGISIDYLELIAKRTGVKFEFRFSEKPFPEAQDGLIEHSGPDLITTMMRTPEREKTILFSKDYFRSPYAIFTHNKDKMFISDMTDLSGRKIALPKGTVIHEKVKKDFPDLKLVLFENDSLSIAAVATKKADAYIGDLTLASFLILEKGLSGLKIAGPSPFGDHVLSMGIRNDWPALVSIIDKALATMSNAEHAEIRNKYISISYQHAERAAYIKRFAIIFGATFLFFLLFIFWNRQLAGMVKKRTAEIREKSDYLKSLTDSMPDAVFSVSMPDRKIEWANDTFGVLGYEAAECIGRTTEFLYPSRQDYLALGEAMDRAIAEGKEVLYLELTMRKKNGDVFPADISISIFKVQGEVASVTGIVRDIYERKHRERRLQEYQDRLRALASQLTVVEEKERRRIAADLHDHVSQALALARMQVAKTKKRVMDAPMSAELDQISDTLYDALQDTRQLMFDLSPPSLNEMGLSAAIAEWLETQIGQRYNIETAILDDFDDHFENKIEESVRAILFRNVRELLFNVVKHAQAKKVSVHLKSVNGRMKFVVEDDGVGFDPEAALHTGSRDGGFGLFSIQERMDDLGGSLEIASEPGKGCKATLTISVGEGKKD